MELAKGSYHDEWGKSISGINPNIEKYKKFRHVDHLTAAGIARGVKAPGSKMYMGRKNKIIIKKE